MKHHACIAIGINQYQFLQPLSYAQRDAETVYQFWVEEAGFTADNCLLITDTSPDRSEMPTDPNRENILDWFESICLEHLEPEDTLCCFFSGYGVHHEGRDYLLPIDGNGLKVEETGIPVRSLFELLAKAPARHRLLLLDINRSQGIRAGDPVGTETLALSEEMGIPTVLSCRPDQVSRETSSLRQGFFTAALLEGLKSGRCKTLADLKSFLSDRLPELTEQHLRPPQNPVFVGEPTELGEFQLQPERAKATATAGTRNGNSAAGPEFAPKQNGIPPGSLSGLKLSPPLKAVDGEEGATSPPPIPPTRGTAGDRPDAGRGNSPTNQQPMEEIMSDRSFFQQLILWSGVTALLLLLGVFFTNRSLFVGSQPTATLPLPPAELSEERETEVSEPATEGTPEGNVASPPPPPATPEEPTATSGETLQTAQVLLQDTSASSLSQAIARAGQIPEDDLGYPEAQLAIERWSWMILDIAEGRAATGNVEEAVAAARLIPEIKRPIYEEAQLQIQKWNREVEQLQGNREKIAAARSQIKAGQASTYSNAISAVSEIQPAEPGYGEAQEAIARWSGEIWKLAQSRANDKQFDTAVQAALLIPPGTPAYQPAQTAIAKWKTQAASPKEN
ncbi:MAG: caspase family protein [Limnospira sp.]